jgi:ABC-type branched-subunit amino acid transport system ATPase component
MTDASPYAVARAGVVRLFQEARVYGRMSVIDNVIVGFRAQRREAFLRLWDPRRSTRRRERELRERALALLDNVGLAAKADEPAAALSYGQQKLVCLVRAMAAEPDVLLLDEPCVGVALPVIAQIEAFIAAARADGRTILLVEHNLEFVGRVADTVVFMHEGQIDTVGEPETVLADERLGRLYFGVLA